MAEVGLIASVISVAGAGIKLSITLYTFSETVATAADSIKAIAKDVSLTSAVLEELSSNLKHDDQARLYSGTALKTAQTVVADCEAVFKQIDGALSKSIERIGGLAGTGNRKRKGNGRGGKVVLSAMEKLKWPFLQPKMQELRANLERLKSTLVLMLNVLTYARKIQTEKQAQPSNDDYQRLLIENLVTANQEATRNFQTLLRTIGPSDETSSITATSTRELSIGESTLVAERVPSDQVQAMSFVPEESDFSRPKSPGANGAELYRDMPAPAEDSGGGRPTISGPSSATEMTMACLKRIQQALDEFEASEENLKSASKIGVSIEVYKHILQSDIDSRVHRPWEVAFIKRLEDGSPATARLDSSGSTGPEKVTPYDPYFSSGVISNPAGVQSGANQRTAALQAQMDDTVNVILENIDKVSQRGERLDSLQDKTDNLSVSAQGFRRGANRVRKQQGWLGTLGSAWNNLPLPRAAIASVDEYLQEKFAAVFYEDLYGEGVGTTLPALDSSSSDISKPAAAERRDTLQSLQSDKKEHSKEPSSPPPETALRHSSSTNQQKTLPITLPSEIPAHHNPVSRVATSPSEMLHWSEPSFLPLAPMTPAPSKPEKADASLTIDTEAESAATKPDARAGSKTSRRHGPSQGKTTLISYLDSNTPDLAQQAGQTVPNDISQSKAEDDTALISSHEAEMEKGEDGVSSLESLLKEWTTLYD